jgi:hypothetical protein
VTQFVAAGAGFLLAVLWFDLMFDVQVIPYRNGEVPEEVLSNIATYYRRVTTTSRPMSRLVVIAMLGTIASVVLELARSQHPRWVGWASLPLILGAVGLAGARTVPNAVRLGARRDPPEHQSRLAKAALLDHALCFLAVAIVLAIQLIFG